MKRNIDSMEEMILRLMSPESIPEKTGILGKLLNKASPDIACALLTAAIANMVGNISDEQWEKMLKTEIPPCKTEGCTCHITLQEFTKALVPIRDLFNKAIESTEGGGFSA